MAAEVTLVTKGAEDLALARTFGLAAADRDVTQWQIVRTGHRIELCSPASLGGLRLDIGPDAAPLRQRLRGARPTDALPRALGLHRRPERPSVVDATAGLLRDALVLAALGCRVTAVERVPALAFLAAASLRGRDVAERLAVVSADAVPYLDGLAAADAPDVVYLDPMFAAPGRAQVKKEMQVCRLLVGDHDADEQALFAAARRAARERVVVKRHAAAAPIEPRVSFAVDGERVRFDVYLRS